MPSGWTLYSFEGDAEDEEEEEEEAEEAPPPARAASGPARRASPSEGGAQEGEEGAADARRGTLDAAKAAAAARRSWTRPRGVEAEEELAGVVPPRRRDGEEPWKVNKEEIEVCVSFNEARRPVLLFLTVLPELW